MDLDGIGYARQLREDRERILARAPASHKARILGRPAPHTVRVVEKREPRAPAKRRFVVVAPVRPTPIEPSAEAIISAILTATEISQYEFLREGRSSEKISRARQMGYWLTKQLRPDMSLNEMGRMFRKDHTTLISGVRRFEEVRDTAPISDWLLHPAITSLLESAK